MKAPPFAYHDPRSVEELKGLLGSLENLRILAGGQSLMPMLNMRYAMPDHVVDINRVDGLSSIEKTTDGLRIGAMTRQRAVERDPLVARHAPVFVEALQWVGHVQTRSRGTFGGSLCHLDPSSEQPCVAALYDAVLHVSGPRGDRDVSIHDWVLGYMTPALEPDEALLAVTLKTWDGPHGYGFEEFARRHGDYAIVCAGALLQLDGAGKISRASIALAGVDVMPVRLREAEALLVGRMPDAATLAEAAACTKALECMSDAQISGDYRRRLAATLTRRALTSAAARAKA